MSVHAPATEENMGMYQILKGSENHQSDLDH